MESVVVTGGTGVLGRQVVGRLLAPGREVQVVSRRARPVAGATVHPVDLRSGDGLDAAFEGAGTIIHCATRFTGGDAVAARNVIAAARRAGAPPHLVYISIVGVDRVPLGYYRTKLGVERLIEHSGVPYTILRATQFHDLLLKLFAAPGRVPVVPVPAGVSFQPVDAGEVAGRLAELAAAAPAGRVADMGGPEVRDAADLARAYLRSASLRRPVVPVRLPGATFDRYRQGGHLAPGHATGRITFEEFLAGQVARTKGAAPGAEGRQG